MHKNDFKISVVIPTYNRGKELIPAVKSVLHQSYPVHEILVCDDGSTDNSKDLIQDLNDPKVKWIDCGKNGGPAIPRNTGISSSEGNWIAFLDSDDEWLPNKLKTQIDTIQKSKTLACSTNAFRIRNGKNAGAYLDYTNESIRFEDLLPCNYIICSSVLVEKNLLVKTSLFPVGKEFIAIEDYALWLKLSTKTDFSFVSEPMLNYMDSAETSIRSSNTDVWKNFELIYRDLKKWVSENHVRLARAQKYLLNYQLIKAIQKGEVTGWDKFKLTFGMFTDDLK